MVILIRVTEPFGNSTVVSRSAPLPEIVCLAFCGRCARELPIDLIANIAHSNKTGYHAIPASRFQSRCNSPVMDESSARKTDTGVRFRKEHGKLPVFDAYLATVEGPIILGRVSVIEGRVGEDAGFIFERVCGRFADWAGLARVDGMRLERIAATETELAPGATVSEFTTARSSSRT